jgi:uncharacterized membrane protein YtjA (UPF0391 family)
VIGKLGAAKPGIAQILFTVQISALLKEVFGKFPVYELIQSL